MEEFLVLGAIGLVGFFTLTFFISRFLLICHPNEVIILSGRKRTLPDGSMVGYRVIRGGRAVRIPLLEKSARMSLETLPVELHTSNAYSSGGIPLRVEAIANIKIDSTEPTLGNAVERFLNKSRDEIYAIAKDTLEGNLRGVLAMLTPEEVNEDRLKFAHTLIDEAESDLKQLGLQLDTLKITNVSDEAGYLESIGRRKTAEVLAFARQAEAQRTAEAEEAEAESRRKAEVAKAHSEQEIQSARIESSRNVQIQQARAAQQIEIENTTLRIKKAELEREAIIKEKEAQIAGEKAQAMFEQELQEERILLQQKKLIADIIEPARAKKEAMELEAIGAAATITETGKAKLQVIRAMGEVYRNIGDDGSKVFMLNMLPEIIEQLSQTVSNIQIDKVSVIDNGGGTGNNNSNGIAKLLTQLPGSVVAMSDMIENATGVDILSGFRKDTSLPQLAALKPPSAEANEE